MINYKKLDKLRESGLWGFRTSDNGIGYNGYVHASVGVWGECSKWTSKATCRGGGFFMQGPGGYGYAKQGSRLEFVETGNEWKSIDGDKIAARRMRILYTGQEALTALFYVTDGNFAGSLDLSGCTFLGDLKIGNVGGWVDLSGCTLPDGLEIGNVGEFLDLSDCTLSDGFEIGDVTGTVYLDNCKLHDGTDISEWGKEQFLDKFSNTE